MTLLEQLADQHRQQEEFERLHGQVGIVDYGEEPCLHSRFVHERVQVRLRELLSEQERLQERIQQLTKLDDLLDKHSEVAAALDAIDLTFNL